LKSEVDIVEFLCQNLITEKHHFVISVSTPVEIPSASSLPSKKFVCLLVWDAREVDSKMISFVAERLMRAGCVYFCCWGPDCERVHDIIDDTELMLLPDDTRCMTTWHSHESISEAIFFSLNWAWPFEEYFDECRTIVGLSIGNEEWGAEIRRGFSNPSLLENLN
jgi:hypothetical protein